MVNGHEYITTNTLYNFTTLSGLDAVSRTWTDSITGLVADIGADALISKNVEFSGLSNSYVRFPSSKITDSFTWRCTFELTKEVTESPTSAEQAHPHIVNSYPQPSFYLRSTGALGTFSGHLYNGVDKPFDPPFKPVVGTKYVITVRWRGLGHDAELFINGAPFATIGTLSIPTTQLSYTYIGNRADGKRAFNGIIYEMALQDTALTDSEILHNSTLSAGHFNV